MELTRRGFLFGTAAIATVPLLSPQFLPVGITAKAITAIPQEFASGGIVNFEAISIGPVLYGEMPQCSGVMTKVFNLEITNLMIDVEASHVNRCIIRRVPSIARREFKLSSQGPREVIINNFMKRTPVTLILPSPNGKEAFSGEFLITSSEISMKVTA